MRPVRSRSARRAPLHWQVAAITAAVVAAAGCAPSAASSAPARDQDYFAHWVLREVAAMPDGYPRQVLTATPLADLRPIHVDPAHPYNDTLRVDLQAFPGPEVRVRQGGRVHIVVENRLHVPTAIHWHGIHMQKQGWMDGAAGFTECGIPPNGLFTYDFTVEQEPGTHWWHAHSKAEFADGLSGALVVLPREGEVDSIDAEFRPAFDQVVMLADWSHERWEDNEQKYMGRVSEYPGYDEGHVSGRPQLPHLPDYPWPSHSVLLNGRGQFPCQGRWVSEADCRVIREYGWCWWENQSLPKPPPRPGRPNFCSGQCNPVRPPFVGDCGSAPPSGLRCEAGANVRLRVINSGAGVPLRFWLDRHKVTIVARDGLAVEPSGPHVAVLLSSGVRYDLVVACDQQAVGQTFKVFGALAAEFYPGISHRFSGVSWFPVAGYALLSYGAGEGNDALAEAVEPQHPPESWPDIELMRSYGPAYASVGLLPAYLEMGLRPRVPRRAQPAVRRIEAHTRVMGNWWNHLVNTTHPTGPLPNRGLRLEWWETDGFAPLRQPREPVLVTSRLGLPLSHPRSFDELDERLIPYFAAIPYDALSPKWYEVVIVNYEGQNHPYHLHGFHAQIIACNYTEVPLQQSPNYDAESGRLVYEPGHYGFPELHEEAPVLTMADTFTVPYFGFIVLRIRSDNPGVWLVHCHMDYHLAAGMGFLLSAHNADGEYELGAPPGDMPMCGVSATAAGAPPPRPDGQQARQQARQAAGDSAAHVDGVDGAGAAWPQSAGLVVAGMVAGYALSVARAGARGRADGESRLRPMPQ